jgi:hypothetical protein
VKNLDETELKNLAVKLLEASHLLHSFYVESGWPKALVLGSELRSLSESLLKDSSSDYRLNSGKEVAVSTSSRLSKDMAACPRGVKVLLLGYGGVLVIGQYSGELFWEQWGALPRRAD